MLPSGYKSTAECWREYPKLPFPENIGARGTAQKRARDACVAASMKGQADPELYTGPAILRDYEALWQSKPPYRERPSDQAGAITRAIGRALDPAGFFGIKTGGDTLRSVAIGWRPPTMTGMARFRELELKGTIIGGAEALAAAGVAPWGHILQTIEQQILPLKLRGDDSDGQLVQVVRQAAASLGRPQPRSLEQAANFVRAEVTANYLDKAAWAARALHLTIVANKAQKRRKTTEQVVSSTVSTVGTALSGTVVGAIVGIPLMAIGLSTSAAAGRTGIEKQRTDNLIEKLRGEFQFELQQRGVAQQARALEARIERAKQEEAALVPLALAEGAKRAQYIQVFVWMGAVSLTTLGVYKVVQIATRRRT